MSAPGFEALRRQLPDWCELDAALRRNCRRHGDFPRWQAALDELPEARVLAVSFGDAIRVQGVLPGNGQAQLRKALQALHPWRKGPFELFGLFIDSEWRSDWKWGRVASEIDLQGARVLDLGCGNGYYGWRMLGAGAHLVVGIERAVLYGMQHLAVQRFIRDGRNHVLPIAFEALPEALFQGRFDAAFSMGLLYHHRDPLAHLGRLGLALAPGGLAVVESLVVPGEQPLAPRGRYARMGNVRRIPSQAQLGEWLADCGFQDIRVGDAVATSVEEQRSTPWMRFESLAEGLDGRDPSRTVEGHPAPARCIALARKAP